MNDSEIIVTVKNPIKWFLYQLGELVVMVGIISLVFNYAYRFLINKDVSGIWFYLSTFALGLIVYILFRRDSIFINRYQFSQESISILSLFGVKRSYQTKYYEWIPSLSKTINFPEQSANLSFYIKNRETGKKVRNYTWKGFSTEDFQNVSLMYGYSGQTDFKQNDIGKK